MAGDLEFDATVVRVRTMVSGEKRLELDLPAESTETTVALMEAQRQGSRLHVTLTVGPPAKRHGKHRWDDPDLLTGADDEG